MFIKFLIWYHTLLLYCCVGNFILCDWSMAIMCQYIRQAHFTTKAHFTAKFFAFALFVHGYSFQLTALSSNSFHMQNFPFYNYNNKAWWWNLLVWHKHGYGLFSQLCSAAQPTKFESCLLKYSQTLYCRHCGDLELVSSLVRVRNRRSLFQSNVCNIFLPGI